MPTCAVVRAGPCPAVPGFTFLRQQDVPGVHPGTPGCYPLGDLSTDNVAAVAAHCDSLPGCVGFNIVPGNDVPYRYCLKDVRGPVSDRSIDVMWETCMGTYLRGVLMQDQLARPVAVLHSA